MAKDKGKAKQSNLSDSQFQVHKKLAKPMEIIGEMVRIKGSHWQGRMSAEEKNTRPASRRPAASLCPVR
jgi:hypothetical protein